MAVENDYNLLVHNLKELATAISRLRDDVQELRTREAAERREPNDTDWANLIGIELRSVDYIFNGLKSGVNAVLASEPGVPVFDAEPPPAPDEPPAV